MKQNWICKRTPMLCLCVVLALLSGCAGQRSPSAAGAPEQAESPERLEFSESTDNSAQSDSSQQADLSDVSIFDLKGGIFIRCSANCTIEKNGKIGQMKQSGEVSGNLPVLKTDAMLGGGIGSPVIDPETSIIVGEPSTPELYIDGEEPISVQIEDEGIYFVDLSTDRYWVSFHGNHPALIQASETGASLKSTEPTELTYCRYIFKEDDTGGIAFSGNIEDSLQIVREDAGVYLVKGLSGAGYLRCGYEFDGNVVEQEYQDGENRNVRIVWKDDTPTITAVEP